MTYLKQVTSQNTYMHLPLKQATAVSLYIDLGKASISPTSSYPRQVGFDLTTVKLQNLGK